MATSDQPHIPGTQSDAPSFRFGKAFGWFLAGASALISIFVMFVPAVSGGHSGVGVPLWPILFVSAPVALLGWGLAKRHRWALRLTWVVLFALFIITVQNAEPREDGWKVALPCFLAWLGIVIYYWRHRKLFH